MQVRQDTPDRLVLEDRPWLLGSILAVVILFLTFLAFALAAQNIWMGVGMALGAALFGVAFVIFVRRVIVIFDRRAGAVVIRSVGVTGQIEATHPLGDITGVGVQTVVNRSTSHSGRMASNSETHRVVLHLQGTDLPLTQVYSAGKGAATCAAAINRWLS